MATPKNFCPILMIGFDKPKNEKEPDPRTCNSKCAWYDDSTEQCAVISLNENILELIDYTCAASINIPSEEDFEGYQEEMRL